MYRDSKWAHEILALQKQDGLWGYFHTLSEPKRFPITTEQALRRLYTLGYDINDPPIAKAVCSMSDCLRGQRALPDTREKTHNWDLFTEMILATWIRIFTLEDPCANRVADQWATVISEAFSTGQYEDTAYSKAYQKVFHLPPRGGRFVDFVSFYQVSLLANCLEEKTERQVLDYILCREEGIYYLYSHCLQSSLSTKTPLPFASKEASRFLGAVELLANYTRNVDRLHFVADWLYQNQNENGAWDMGGKANDKVYFPLSDHWRTRENRERDCTNRIRKLLIKLRLV